jgi:hypothetical protein
MAIYCPLIKMPVVYLTCKECENRVCEEEEEDKDD